METKHPTKPTAMNNPVSAPTEIEVLYPHLTPDYRMDAGATDDTRIDLITSGMVIEHAAYARAMAHAHWILSMPAGTPGRGMLLMGEPGAGKSTFGEELNRAYTGRIAVVSAEGARSMRELYGRVLQSLDGPVARSMHTPDRELVVVRVFQALKIQALIVDEVQDLAKGTDRELQRVLAGIKYLTNVARIPLICLGTPEATQTFRNDKHLAQRLPPFHLPVWKVDQAFADLIGNLETMLPLRKPSALRNEPALKYLVECSGGSLRTIMGRITCAAVRAILSGEECLTLNGLKEAEVAPPLRMAQVSVHD
ncbi:MAG: hypothetical protein EPN68_06475 [Rhodanobacter sp.]|nr:MAG: hypothetical protein EPN68_06475 [Rhodanobacter sp.]